MTVTQRYLLDNREPLAGERFALLDALFDPASRSVITSVPLGPNPACWEVGAGSGSIARLLYRRVQPLHGTVLATDVDLRWTRVPPGVMALKHDVVTEDVPSGPWDLIHARLVIQHLPNPQGVIDRLAAALKPGGYLIIEELDPLVPYCPDPVNECDQLVNRVGNAFTDLLAKHANPHLGRVLHRMMAGAGLVGILNHGHLYPAPGGSLGAQLMQVNVRQCWNQLRGTHYLTTKDLERYLMLMADPKQNMVLPVFFSAKGRRT